MSLGIEPLGPLAALVLILVGMGAGFVNTLAGGGSMLTLPLLMLVGLPADVANGTNRLSVLAQSAVSAWSFDRRGRLDRRATLAVVLPTLAGSFVGASAASATPPDVLKPLLIGSLLLVAVTLVYRPRTSKMGAAAADEPPQRPRRPAHLFGLFFIGLYGGFAQAGVGFFLLAFLSGALRYDLVRANALKVVVVAAFTAVALAVFVVEGQVDWFVGAVLAFGTVVGAEVGVRFAVKTGAETIRKVVFVSVVLFAIGALIR